MGLTLHDIYIIILSFNNVGIIYLNIKVKKTNLGIKKPFIIAHRGFSGKFCENTFEAFEEAIACGADFIEFDVNRTKDGHLVIYHNYTINGRFLKDMNLDEVKEIRICNNQGIPTLDEIIQNFADVIGLYIEVKDRKIVEALVDRVKKLPSVVIASFDHLVLRKVKEYNPEIKISVLMGDVILDPLPILKSLRADYFHPCYESRSPEPDDLLDEEYIAYLQHMGYGVISWAEDRVNILKNLIKKNFDGISTNRPDIVFNLVNSSLPTTV